MEIINPGNGPAPAEAVDNSKPVEKEDSEFVKGVQEAIKNATKEVRAAGNDEPKKMPENVDVQANTERDPVMSSMSDAQDAAASVSNISGNKNAQSNVKVTQEQKDAFLDCLITGDRYRETFTRFGGKLKIVIRSRTTDETSAILSYVRRNMSMGVARSRDIYSTYIRRAIVAAQVEEVNGVKYGELEKPYYYEETPEGLTPPAWEKQMGVWGGKSEQIFSICADCVIEFEARYWHMMAHSNDENFWKPGESTGD